MARRDDVVLTIASAGEAPIGLALTGDARFNSLRTLLYTPCLTLPVRDRVDGRNTAQ